MPILAKEPDIFPEHLLDATESVGITGEPWWALYTLPRREKELMRRLRGLGIGFYSPIIEQRKRSPQGRIRKSYLPLFASYVFMHGGDEARQRALTTNCISRCLTVPDSDRLVDDLRQIRRLILANFPLTPESRIQPGTPVRVRSGPLMGVEGVVVRRQNKERLLVSVRFLQQGASALLEDFQVEAI
ncbi:MAG TPA: transcription termination/antitermination NusG family protein [Pirellulales bacterium]|jgi:transcriptional antiterminator RfaH|nr:transcription termination/antitermination NusG family protein [Pirellulales bacterium]